MSDNTGVFFDSEILHFVHIFTVLSKTVSVPLLSVQVKMICIVPQ